MFAPIFQDGWRIKFAHRTFPWTSEAPGKAAVHCVIIGFTRAPGTGRLFAYEDTSADPIDLPVAEGVNAYLVDGPNVLVPKRSKMLSPLLAEVEYGNKPSDGGHLIVTAQEHDEVASDPIAAKYLRPFIGSKELLYNIPRWCLWLVDVDPQDMANSAILKQRVAAVRDFRAKSTAPGERAGKWQVTDEARRSSPSRTLAGSSATPYPRALRGW